MRRLSVAGSSASSAGTTMWALMTACAPPAIAAWKGASSRARRVAVSAPMRGSARCESTLVSPWPGKCLTQAMTPADWSPST